MAPFLPLRRPRFPTIGEKIIDKLRDPTVWTRNEANQYRSPTCPFMVQKDVGWDIGASVWDDDEPGKRIPLTSSEESRIYKALRRIDGFLRDQVRREALAKFNAECRQ